MGAAPGLTGQVATIDKAPAVSTTTLWAFALYGVYTYLGVELRQHAHFGSVRFGSGLVAVGLAIYGAGALAGNLAGGSFADSRGAQTVVLSSLVALAIVLIMLGALSSLHLVLLVGLGLFSFCAYPCFSAHQKRLVTRFGSQPGALLAWNNTAMYLGILMGSAVGGRILASAGFPALTAAAVAVALAAALSTRRVMAAPSHQL